MCQTIIVKCIHCTRIIARELDLCRDGRHGDICLDPYKVNGSPYSSLLSTLYQTLVIKTAAKFSLITESVTPVQYVTIDCTKISSSYLNKDHSAIAIRNAYNKAIGTITARTVEELDNNSTYIPVNKYTKVEEIAQSVVPEDSVSQVSNNRRNTNIGNSRADTTVSTSRTAKWVQQPVLPSIDELGISELSFNDSKSYVTTKGTRYVVKRIEDKSNSKLTNVSRSTRNTGRRNK